MTRQKNLNDSYCGSEKHKRFKLLHRYINKNFVGSFPNRSPTTFRYWKLIQRKLTLDSIKSRVLITASNRVLQNFTTFTAFNDKRCGRFAVKKAFFSPLFPANVTLLFWQNLEKFSKEKKSTLKQTCQFFAFSDTSIQLLNQKTLSCPSN